MSHPSPTRVAQIVRPAEGGIRRHVSLLIGGLESSKFSCELYAPNDFTLEGSAPHVTRSNLDISATTSIPRDLRAIRTLAPKLNNRFDVVHCHGLRAALIGVIAARRVNIPALLTAHNLVAAHNTVLRFALILVSRRSRAIIAVSTAVSNSLQACGVDRSIIHVIPNGIRLYEYSAAKPVERCQLEVHPAGPILAYVGRLSPEKGVDTLLDAYRIVCASHPDANLLIVGSGPDDAKLRSGAADLTGVRFLGGRTDIPALLATADLVVVPSYTEGQGIVAIEAMASSRPVVATNVGGLAETVVDGETGILTPRGDSRAFASAIVSLLDDPHRAAAMGKAGRRRALAKYSVTQMIDSIQHLYRDVCNYNVG